MLLLYSGLLLLRGHLKVLLLCRQIFIKWGQLMLLLPHWPD